MGFEPPSALAAAALSYNPVVLRELRLSLLLPLLLLSLCGCGAISGLTGGLPGRAAQYYNYLIGRYPQQAYSSYLSPAYKKAFTRDDLRRLDESHRKGDKPNLRYPVAKSDDVLVERQGNFAYSVVDPELGDAYAVLQAQRWVRSGSGWYVYTGSAAEIQAYGPFPTELAPPALAHFAEKHKAEKEKEAAKAAMKAGKSKSKAGGESSQDAGADADTGADKDQSGK